ncbi:unnamed protein product [Gadus morhua 'NCC']
MPTRTLLWSGGLGVEWMVMIRSDLHLFHRLNGFQIASPPYSVALCLYRGTAGVPSPAAGCGALNPDGGGGDAETHHLLVGSASAFCDGCSAVSREADLIGGAANEKTHPS